MHDTMKVSEVLPRTVAEQPDFLPALGCDPVPTAGG